MKTRTLNPRSQGQPATKVQYLSFTPQAPHSSKCLLTRHPTRSRFSALTDDAGMSCAALQHRLAPRLRPTVRATWRWVIQRLFAPSLVQRNLEVPEVAGLEVIMQRSAWRSQLQVSVAWTGRGEAGMISELYLSAFKIPVRSLGRFIVGRA